MTPEQHQHLQRHVSEIAKLLYRAHLRSLELSGNLERTLLYCNPHGLFQ
jgi:hypothetical protein